MNVEFPFWEKVKTHVKEHKLAYSNAATAIVIAGFTWTIMRGRYAGIQRVPDTADRKDTVFVRPLSFLSKQNVTTNVVSVIERDGRGHPGYLIYCLETNEIFPSQKAAALAANAYPSVMSGHLNGKVPDVHGKHYQRIILPEVA